MDENHKRRSSLRIKAPNFEYSSNNSLKKIQWNISDNTSHINKKSFKKEPKTPYISYDGEEDIYLKRITEINNLDASKIKLEELAKKFENEYNSRDIHESVVISDDDGEKDKENSKSGANLSKQYNSHQVRGSDDNLFDEDASCEVIKNTFFNKFIGKINKDHK